MDMFKKKIKVGLDIGTYSVKFVQLAEGPKGYSLVKMGYKEISQNNQTDEKAAGKERPTFKALQDLWREHKVRAKTVSLALSDPSIYSRQISIPRVAEEELIKAIKWQAEKYIPFSIENAIVDFQTLDMSSKKSDSNEMDLIIITAKRETVDGYIELLKSLKISPTIIDVSPFAMTRSFFKNYEIDKEEMTAIIDMGTERTSLIIVKGDSLQLVRNIELGGNSFTRAIATHLAIDMDEAERIKKSCRGNMLNKNGSPDIFSMIEPLLEDLAKELSRSFAYCERELVVRKIDSVVLCGGAARFKGLAAFLSEKLAAPVELGNPFKSIDMRNVRVDSAVLNEIAPTLMPALGAALA